LLSSFFCYCSTIIKRFADKLAKLGKGVSKSRARAYRRPVSWTIFCGNS
jgi:hypothetical protein